MSNITFNEIMASDKQDAIKFGIGAGLSVRTLELIKENFYSFSEEDKQRCMGVYFELDRLRSRQQRESNKKIDHNYLNFMWDILNSYGRKYMIEFAKQNATDFFWKCIQDHYKNDEVNDFFAQLGMSSEDIVRKIYKHRKVRDFSDVSKSEMDKRYENAIKMGISPELIKANPILLAINSEILNARKNAYEIVNGTKANMTMEDIKYLTMPDIIFERQFGTKIRGFAKLKDEKKYNRFFRPSKKYGEKERIIRTYALIQSIYHEEQKEIEEIVANMFFAEGITAKELKGKWPAILQKDDGENGGKGHSDEVIIGLQGEAQSFKEMEQFWDRLSSRLGENMKYSGIRFSTRGGKNITKYLLIDVGEYSILEPVGQAQNRTYVIQSKFTELLPYLTRDEVVERGIGFRLNHDPKLGRYNYESNRLIKIIDSLEKYQAKEKKEISREDYFEILAEGEKERFIERESFADSHVLKMAAILGAIMGEQEKVRGAKEFVKSSIRKERE